MGAGGGDAKALTAAVFGRPAERQGRADRVAAAAPTRVLAYLRGIGAPSPTDAQLVSRAQRGDAEAFGCLYDRYVEDVYRYALARVRDVRLAEDLTQDVFVNALDGLPRFRWQGALRPWLLRIAHNRVANHWRSVGRRIESVPLSDEGDGEDDDLVHGLVGGTDPECQAERDLGGRDLDQALGSLSDIEREVLALRFEMDLSVADTAGAMGRSEDSVRSIQYRAVRRLARRLQAEDGTS